jgi:hypothetical protein
MWSFIHTRKGSAAVATVNAKVEQFEELSAELGLEGGVHNLPQSGFDSIINAKLWRLSEERHGPPDASPALLLEREAELQKERQAIEGRCLAYRSHNETQNGQPVTASAPVVIHWRPALINVIVIFALFGLALGAFGIELGWRGVVALTLLAALVMVNLPVLPAITRRLAALPALAGYGLTRYRDYRRLQAQAAALDKRILQTRLQREAETERRRLAEEWIARTRELILSHYSYHRAKGATAAQLADKY